VLKYIYRIFILVCVFIASLGYFSRDIKEVVFDINNTTVMADTTLPLVIIKRGDQRINLLHGYSSNLNANKVRDTVIPVDQDKTFEVEIDQKEYDIKKMNYELREFVGNKLIEESSISVFEEDGNIKRAKIKIGADLEEEKEYAIKITIISSQSKKIYYYQRVKLLDNAYLEEKLDFVMDFHNAILDKETAKNIQSYLETKSSVENTTLGYVNINSSLDLVSWGNMKPIVITDVIPNIIEIYSETALIELEYMIESKITGFTNQFKVRECFRIRYSPDRIYLLDYQRYMDEYINDNNIIFEDNRLRVGILSDNYIPFIHSANGNKIVFVRNNELWLYDLVENKMTCIFTFRQQASDYIRDTYDQHAIRILDIDAEGNVDFIVYGYMNRGQYEGKVALILYQYILLDNRIEERAYIPIEEPYQMLKENIGEFAYISTLDVFYFHIYNNIYAYNIITRELKELAIDINPENIIILMEHNSIAWQDDKDPRRSLKINIMNLETGSIEFIEAPKGYRVRLLGKIDGNIIYGFMKEEKAVTLLDGSILTPLERVIIASIDKTILKNYQEPGYYITDIQVTDNLVELYRVQETSEDNYKTAPADFIMNQINYVKPLVSVEKQYSEQVLEEVYLTLPDLKGKDSLFKVDYTMNTVISQDTTLRLPKLEQNTERYYAYIYGDIEGAYMKASDAIRVANEGYGVVLDNSNQLIWERGVKATRSSINKLQNLDWTISSNRTIESCLELMLAFQGVNVSLNQLNVNNSSVLEILNNHSKYTALSLTGISLDEALYFIYKGMPVLAMTNSNEAVLIYGYDNYNIMVIDPKLNRTTKLGLQSATDMFKRAGNMFITSLIQ